MKRVTWLLLLSLLIALPAQAQERRSLARSMKAESLRDLLPPPSQAQAASQSTGHPVRNWMMIGLGAGLVVGAVATSNTSCPAGRSCSTAGVAVPFYMVLGGLAGAVVGLVTR